LFFIFMFLISCSDLNTGAKASDGQKQVKNHYSV
jgi:hypothetical protein